MIDSQWASNRESGNSVQTASIRFGRLPSPVQYCAWGQKSQPTLLPRKRRLFSRIYGQHSSRNRGQLFAFKIQPNAPADTGFPGLNGAFAVGDFMGDLAR